MKLKIIFFRNGQSCQAKNTTLQECKTQHRGSKVSCLAGVTQRNPHVTTDFQKMKQDWQTSQGTGLRPWGSALGWTTETQRKGAESPARFLLLLKGLQLVQADPMGKASIAIEVAPCFLGQGRQRSLVLAILAPSKMWTDGNSALYYTDLPGKVRSSNLPSIGLSRQWRLFICGKRLAEILEFLVLFLLSP